MAGKENVDPDLDDFKPTKRGRKGSIEPSKGFKPATNDEEVNVLTKATFQIIRKKTQHVFKGFQRMEVFEGGKLSC